jgi:glycosyltransferase involved in cell wall biosynthesis
LLRLLNTLKSQETDFEIVVSEDKSPKREEIITVVNQFQFQNPNVNIRLNLNQVNLGYDGNFKQLLRLSKGEFCVFMGDDDLMEIDALKKIQTALDNNSDIGFILRAWEEVDLNGNSISVQKYYSDSKLFQSGVETVIEFFRKSVFISGLVIHRETAIKYETNKVDGKLLYQIYLLANILLDKNGYYIADILTKRVKGAEHFFGSAEIEKGKFSPKELTIEHSLTFMQGFLDIVEIIETNRNVNIKNKILIDFSKYSYGFLSIQRHKKIKEFLIYSKKLAEKEFNRTIHFYLYVGVLIFIGEKKSEKLISLIKKKLGSIPRL